jgi:hypothetical protein
VGRCHSIEINGRDGGKELALVEYAVYSGSVVSIQQQRRDTPDNITREQPSQTISCDRKPGHPLALLF